MNKWYQIYVSHPTADAVRVMRRCDPILQCFGAAPVAPDGVPILEQDGTIEVRAFSSMSSSMAQSYLVDQGFVINRIQENE